MQPDKVVLHYICFENMNFSLFYDRKASFEFFFSKIVEFQNKGQICSFHNFSNQNEWSHDIFRMKNKNQSNKWIFKILFFIWHFSKDGIFKKYQIKQNIYIPSF